MTINYTYVIIAFLTSLIFSLILTPLVIKICNTKGLYDEPDARKVHKQAIPRLGGTLFLPSLGIGVAVASIVMYNDRDKEMMLNASSLIILAGAMLIYLIGILDDLKGMKATQKFAIQTVAAMLFPLCNLMINNLHGIFGLYEIPIWASYPLTVFVILLIVVTNIVIVPQSMVYVVERLGSYSDTWSAGLHVKIPFIERIAKKVSLKEQVADFPPQPVITRDNVTMQIDTVVFFQVMDAKLYTYGVNQPIAAIESLSATTLRNIIGEMELDHTLTSRDVINGKITAILDEATDKWGIKVNRVEVKNIIPPREIQEAMEKQMKAEREKRAVILKADGEKQAAITAAEGEKEAAILRADAVKQQRILEAEGEAQAILAVQQANADAIRLLNEAMPSDKVLAIRSLEALAKVANGKATKIIIPSELQNLGGVVPSIKELLTDPKDAE